MVETGHGTRMTLGLGLRLAVALAAVAAAHDIPYASDACPSALQLVRKRPLKTAIATLWIEEAPKAPHRALLPRSFREAALARLDAFLCAVRAVTDLPVIAGTAHVDAAGQAAICDAPRRVGALNLTAVDTRTVFRPVYDPAAARREKMWFNLSTNRAPQARTDGWKTRYKFVLFNCTRWAAQFVYLDLDVVLLADPTRAAARWARPPLVAAFECSYRGYIGMHGSVIVFRTDGAASAALFAKSAAHDYLVFTNGDQDIQDAYWCPHITALPATSARSACATKARLDAPFRWRYAGETAPVFLSGPAMTGRDGVPHIHDAYVRRGRCADVARKAGVAATACACLRPDRESFRRRRVAAEPGRRLSVYGRCHAFAAAAAPDLSAADYRARERGLFQGRRF